MVLKNSEYFTSTFSIPVAPPPHGQYTFGGTLDQKVIIGRRKDIYRYNIENNEWVQLRGDGQDEFDRSHTVARAVNYRWIGSKCCAIHDDVNLVIGCYPNYCMRLLQLKSDETNKASNKINKMDEKCQNKIYKINNDASNIDTTTKQTPVLTLPVDEQQIRTQSVNWH